MLDFPLGHVEQNIFFFAKPGLSAPLEEAGAHVQQLLEILHVLKGIACQVLLGLSQLIVLLWKNHHVS